MRRTDRPHGYRQTPDGICLICNRPEDAEIHSDAAIRPFMAPAAGPSWSRLPLPSRLLGIGVGLGLAMVFVAGCAAVAARLLAWGF